MRHTRAVLALVFVAGLAGSIVATEVQRRAFAARNSSGTYSLPSGNPVVSHTSISTAWANTTLADIGTELTNSIDRGGRGSPTAQISFYAGSISAPGVSFISDLGSGLYRAASHDLRMSVNGVDLQKWTTTGATVPLGLTATQSQANAAGITTTGNGTAAGATSTGGATNGNGGNFAAGGSSPGANGDPASAGVTGTGSGAGDGVGGFGGASNGSGVFGMGGATNGIGVSGNGAGTGAGGNFSNGTAATSGTRQDALILTNGDIKLDGVVNPASTTAIKNRLTPKNIIKAWGFLTVTGSGGTSATCVVTDGFNLASCSSPAVRLVDVTMASALANTNFAVTAMSDTAGCIHAQNVSEQGNQRSTTVAGIFSGSDLAGFWSNGQVCTLSVIIIGAQ